MNPKILNREFQHPSDGWYQIEPAGDHLNRASKIVQVIDHEAVQAIVNRFNADAGAGKLSHGHEMLIDHEHFKHDADKETIAYGWLQKLQNRADGIYGQVRWTNTGRAAVDGGDYRFFSTEYDPADLKVLHSGTDISPVSSQTETHGRDAHATRKVRPLRLDGLTLTNDPNNKGGRPITNRSGTGSFAKPGSGPVRFSSETHGQDAHATTPAANQTKKKTMNKIAMKLGLTAEAGEDAILDAVTKLLNRADIAPDALAKLQAEHETFGEQNQTLLAEQSEALLDTCGVKDDKVRNRLRSGLTLLKNRQERLGYLADFGYQPGENKSVPQTRVLNRGTGQPSAGSLTVTAGEPDEALVGKIKNRASEIQARGVKFDNAWNQARREILGMGR